MFHKAICAALLAAAGASCTDDLLYDRTAGPEGSGGNRVYFSVTPPNGADVVLTRADDDKVAAQDKEKAIYTLRIMVFDNNNNRIPGEVLHHLDNSFPTDGMVLRGRGVTTTDGNITSLAAASPISLNEGFSIPCFTEDVHFRWEKGADGHPTGKATVILSSVYETLTEEEKKDVITITATKGADGTAASASQCTVWALANMGRWENSVIGNPATGSSSIASGTTPTDVLNQITTRDELRRLYGERLAEGFATNRDFLPMVGTVHQNETTIPVVDHTYVVGEKTPGNYVTAKAQVPQYGDEGTTFTYGAPATIDLTKPVAIGSPVEIKMDQIVAKVRFNISGTKQYRYSDGYESYETEIEGKTLQSQVDWDFYFDDWTVEGLPRYTYLIPHQYDIADYLSSSQYKTDANIGDRDFSKSFYVPTDETEAEAFTHNGFGSGKGDGQDWIYAGQTGPPSSIDATDTDYAEWQKEQKYIENDPVDGKNYFHFYTYGNRRGDTQGEAKTSNLGGSNYGEGYTTDGVTDNEALKTLKAPDNASFLVITGIVRKVEKDAYGNELSATSQSVVYKIALGCNRTNDYNVYRNTCYTLHIKVRGFSQSDLSVEGDVQADNYNSSVHQIYNLQVSAPYINFMDCHYDKRYVQLTGGEGSAELALYDIDQYKKADGTAMTGADDVEAIAEPLTNATGATSPSWVKMAFVGDNEGDDYLYKFETDNTGGKTRYYLKMDTPVKRVNNILDIDDTGHSLEILDFSSTETNVAVCAEEYVGDASSTPTEPRYAILQIKHIYKGTMSAVLATLTGTQNIGKYIVKDADGDNGTGTITNADGTTTPGDGQVEVYKFIKIVQYPPYDVTYEYYDTEGNTKSNELLVERFEEYTMPLDPRNSGRSDISAGLRWGWSRYGDSSQTSGYSFYEFTPKDTPDSKILYQNCTYDGNFNTPIIATQVTLETNDKDNVKDGDFPDEITAETQIQNIVSTRYSHYGDFAARYCYDKGAGTTDETENNHHKWYLPSIEELNGLTGDKAKVGSADFGEMNSKASGTNGDDGPIYWSSTTYTDPNNYPPELIAYWQTYHIEEDKEPTPYKYKEWWSSEEKTVYGWDAAWRKANDDRVVYRTILGQAVGTIGSILGIKIYPYSLGYLEEVYNYMEAQSHPELETYPFNCSVACCNGMRYLVNYSRKWNADNSGVANATLPPRKTEYRVRAVRAKPQ